MNKKIVITIIIVLVVGTLGYVTLVKKPSSIEQGQSNNLQNTHPDTLPEQNNIQTSSNVIQCGSVSQKILTQYDYQPTSSEKEATIKSLTCINQAIIKCSPALLAISKDNETMNITVKGQEKSGCNVSVQKFIGEIMTCPLPSDYVADLQRKFTVSNYDGTIVTDLINNINAEISSGNKSGSCTVTK